MLRSTTARDRADARSSHSLDAVEGVDGSRFVHTGSAWVLAPGLHLGGGAPSSLARRTRSTRPRTTAACRASPEAGTRWINLRLFNVFGRYESPRLVPHLVERLVARGAAELSHGEQVRDFNDVDDIAEAFAAALRAHESAWDAMYHIGSGRGTSARELVQIVAERARRAEPLRFGASKTPTRTS